MFVEIYTYINVNMIPVTYIFGLKKSVAIHIISLIYVYKIYAMFT